MRQRKVIVALQLAFVAVVVGFFVFAVRDSWSEAAPRLRQADVLDLVLATALLSAYYLLFVLGWRWILRALAVDVSYAVALQSEMASMLAKYVPGGVWTPAARVLWLRRAGSSAPTAVVVSSILLEAGLSALAGVGVFVVGLAATGGGDAPLVPVLAFAALVTILLQPRVFGWIVARAFRPFGGVDLRPLPYRLLLALLSFYAFTWLVGGAALLFLLRAVGGTAGVESIAYLGGAAAVGAIVAVLAVFAPSGLGVREASMYGLILAVASPGLALGAIVLNRIAITVVEAGLLGAGVAFWRWRGGDRAVLTPS